MSKRILPIFMIVSLLLSIVVPTFASSGGFAVYAFAGGYGRNPPNSTNSSTLQYTAISPGQSLYFGARTSIGGYFIVLPPSDVGGYLYVLGYYAISVQTTSGNAWTPLNTSTYYTYIPTYYQLQSALAPPSSGENDQFGEPFVGYVYIPPHEQSLDLLVYGSTGSYSAGVVSVTGATVVFVPDSTASTDLLQQIVTQVTNIKNEITSTSEQNQDAQQILDQMDDLLAQIDELTQQIEDVTVRPPPDTILPSPPADLLPPVDPAGQLGFEAVTSILSLPLILSFLLMVFTLALIRYVLFGKSQ